VRATWDLLTHIVGTAPIWFGPMLLAWLLAVGFTQGAKYWLRDDLPARTRHRATQLIAILSALVTSFALWPEELHWKHGIAVGAAVGLWAPASYSLLARVVWKRWPWLGEKLSGDKSNSEK